jgi:hypothetical protein
MKIHDKRAYRLLQAKLRSNSFGVYVELLDRLLRAHREYSFLKPLSDALRRRDFLELYQRADSLSVQQYTDATQHFVANQFCLLIKKYPWPKNVLFMDPRKRGLETFWTAEKRSGRVNQKFSFLNWNRSRDVFLTEARAAREWIRTTIGGRPSYRRIFEKADFGAGASVGVHGNATHILAKLSSEKWSVTPGAMHHGFGGLMANIHYLEGLLPRGGDSRFFSVDYEYAFKEYSRRIHWSRSNKISFVPKTAKTFRTIAVEPLLNGFVQKGIDLELRKKLLGVNLDLGDQSRNQRFAREGSIEDGPDGFVTIDLKSASDSVSIELCRYLLPESWFDLLDRTRSAYGRIGKEEEFLYAKFCSMGNGFCFPLETLIFASACFSVGCGLPGRDFSVYGDDIIVRKKHAASVLALLQHWGFKANLEKTFLEGPFRESCGADWFGGEDVRPYTLDHALDTVENVFKFLNLTRRNERAEKFFSCVRKEVLKLLPVQFQFFRPLPGQADTGIDTSGDEHLLSTNCRFSQRSGKWSWLELAHIPVIDESRIGEVRDKPWLIGVALRGTLSIPYGMLEGLPGVTFRTLTRTKVVRKGYSSTSNWLPTPRGA